MGRDNEGREGRRGRKVREQWKEGKEGTKGRGDDSHPTLFVKMFFYS